MTHEIRGVRVEEYAYYVNKLCQNVGLEIWIWRQIVTSQRPHTKYKWPPYATKWNASMKIFCFRHATGYMMTVDYCDLISPTRTQTSGKNTVAQRRLTGSRQHCTPATLIEAFHERFGRTCFLEDDKACVDIFDILPSMGVGRIFSRGTSRAYFQNFSRGGKSGEICFFPLKTKKTTFFAEHFKIQERGKPPTSDAYAYKIYQAFWWVKIWSVVIRAGRKLHRVTSSFIIV